MSAVSIHWSGLAEVAVVSLVFGVGIVVVFALGVVGLSKLEQARGGMSGGPAKGASGDGSKVVPGAISGSPGSRAGGYALAGTAFALCGAAVLYGLYLIIPQFHR